MKWFGRRSKSEKILDEVEALASVEDPVDVETEARVVSDAVSRPTVITEPSATSLTPASPMPAAQVEMPTVAPSTPTVVPQAELDRLNSEIALLRTENGRLRACLARAREALAEAETIPQTEIAAAMAPAGHPAQAAPAGFSSQSSDAGVADLRSMLADLKREISEVKQVAARDPYLSGAMGVAPMAGHPHASLHPQAASPMAPLQQAAPAASAVSASPSEDVRALLAELKGDIEALRAEQREATRRGGSEDLREMLDRLKDDIRSLKEEAPRLTPANDLPGSPVHDMINDLQANLAQTAAQTDDLPAQGESGEGDSGKETNSSEARGSDSRDELAERLERMLAELHEELRQATRASDGEDEDQKSAEEGFDVVEDYRKASGV